MLRHMWEYTFKLQATASSLMRGADYADDGIDVPLGMRYHGTWARTLVDGIDSISTTFRSP